MKMYLYIEKNIYEARQRFLDAYKERSRDKSLTIKGSPGKMEMIITAPPSIERIIERWMPAQITIKELQSMVRGARIDNVLGLDYLPDEHQQLVKSRMVR